MYVKSKKNIAKQTFQFIATRISVKTLIDGLPTQSVWLVCDAACNFEAKGPCGETSTIFISP